MSYYKYLIFINLIPWSVLLLIYTWIRILFSIPIFQDTFYSTSAISALSYCGLLLWNSLPLLLFYFFCKALKTMLFKQLVAERY